MVKKTEVPSKEELFKLDNMDLLKLIKQLRDEIKELRLTIRARNVTVREEKAKRRNYLKLIQRYRQAVGPITKVEQLYKNEPE